MTRCIILTLLAISLATAAASRVQQSIGQNVMVELPVPPVALPTDAPVQAATSPAGGGALPATSPLLVSRNKLKTVLINPMCTWAAKLKTPELYALLFNPQYPSLDSVTTWSSICASLYTGVGQRMFERRGEVISYADVLVVLACEEMYMKLGPAVDSGAANPFATRSPTTSAACTSLLKTVGDQIDKHVAAITNTAYRVWVFNHLLDSIPPAPSAAAPYSGLSAYIACRRAVRATKVWDNPDWDNRQVLLNVAKETKLDYTGVAMQSRATFDQDPAATLWAAVIVKPSGQSSRRLGWVLAADLGYCQGSCSSTGEFCSAAGSPCCSGTCARIRGDLKRGVPGGTVPFESSFDGAVSIQYDSCPAPPKPACESQRGNRYCLYCLEGVAGPPLPCVAATGGVECTKGNSGTLRPCTDYALTGKLEGGCYTGIDDWQPGHDLQLAYSRKTLAEMNTLTCTACKKMGQECTAVKACCRNEGTCVLAGTTGKRRCTKPPTLSTSPVASLTASSAGGVVTAIVKLAASPVANANGGVVDKYKVSLVLPGTSTRLTVETGVSTSVVFKETSTVLLGGARIPKGTLCNKKWKIEFSAKNGAGYATTYTTTAAYLVKPAGCPSAVVTGVRVFVVPYFYNSRPFNCKGIPAALQMDLRKWLAEKAGKVAIDRVSIAVCTDIAGTQATGSRRLTADGTPATLAIGLQVTTVTQGDAQALTTKLEAANLDSWAFELTDLFNKDVGQSVAVVGSDGLSIEILGKTYPCALPGQTCDPNAFMEPGACCFDWGDLGKYQGRIFGELKCLPTSATKYTCGCKGVNRAPDIFWCFVADAQR